MECTSVRRGFWGKFYVYQCAACGYGNFFWDRRKTVFALFLCGIALGGMGLAWATKEPLTILNMYYILSGAAAIIGWAVYITAVHILRPMFKSPVIRAPNKEANI